MEIAAAQGQMSRSLPIFSRAATTWRAKKAMRDHRTFLLTICITAASKALAGQLEPAQKAMTRALELNSDLRASNLRDLAPFRRAEDFATFAKGLRKAGLPE